ncbi:oxidoreductase [Pseudothermotoga hypogea DSM 11164 = NBRC 106472]|uniref:Oxidoreductase n=1 Tax=Pseudothermotoga hypogea DSM 11164 = NBRC 106472 TaxID=1123384 RepID=A0A0X1KT01_9THEM|nr:MULTISPECIES: FAD-dependent oxidoreductase [Pseudothermotoga]AJC74395.1 oxidoreductase [Pseudothermotoga hypogea DSM 11164 = NBRC 106472]MBC7122750.1 FAD-dependent oxidoreductase [Pseudothermotoga sp.]MDI6863382.1 FAD-dependent oxidoreductase [Pseudothermotoga sp.]
MKTDVLVIGAGAAGMAAAIAAAKRNLKVVIAERDEITGGILNQCIHNGFGLHYFREELTGPEYAERFREQLSRYAGAIDVLNDCHVLRLNRDRTALLVSPKNVFELEAKVVVYAAGARERPFGSLMIPGDRPSGIFTAGVAQRLMNIDNRKVGRKALIVGSGDIGMIMARRLTLEGIEVVGVVERLPYPGGLLRNVIQCLKDFNIPLYLSSTVVEVKGSERLEEVVVASVDEQFRPIPGTEKSFKVDTLVLSVGLIPQVEMLNGLVTLDKRTRGIACSNTGQSSNEWIFAAGNCTAVFDLVDYVTKEGERAGEYASRYVNGERFSLGVPIVPGENVMLTFPNYYNDVDDLTLYLRCKKPMEKALLKVGGFEKTFEDLIPSEMIVVKIPKQKLSNLDRIEVKLEEV